MRVILTLTFILLSLSAFNQVEGVWLHPNAGQWDEKILYKVDLSMGEMLVSKEGFCYSLHNIQTTHTHSTEANHKNEKYSTQIIKSNFLNSDWKGGKIESCKSIHYRNYFIGNDQKKWKSNIFNYQKVELIDYYKGINLLLDGTSNQLKYSFIVEPNANISKIQYKIEGANEIFINENGDLVIKNNFGEITESKPKAWNEIEGKKVDANVKFKLKDGIVSFEFPNGYDHKSKLVIDPTLTFSTFTGATMDNWGMTATPDLNGNLYAGGIVFTGTGSYPTTSGAFDLTYNGGTTYTYVLNGATFSNVGFDISISKFNSTGTSLLFSTYLGGSGNEAPHSLVTDANGDLYLFGVTSSSNFPISTGAFDNSYNGGPYVAENELGYNTGADLYVTHFNANGSAIIGSTFVGGTGTDGINIGALNYNYGDSFRGEIIIDNQGNVLVSSTTQSSDFPRVNASQNSLNGIQDAVLFKMNSTLTTMIWSTYFGGNGLESGNSVQVSTNGFVYLTGGTNSTTLPINSGEDLSFNGGVSDGYVVRLNASTGAVLSGTFLGLNEYDQAYFVQLDVSNNVYLYGQTESAWTISNGLYGNSNSGQFIRKYNTNLTTILWTTMIGAGTGNVEISPTAFLVSNCGDIYIAGWGGFINNSYSNQARFSTSNGFPITSDAFQSTTNGNNFYLALLGQNATTLKYATFMGGAASSYNHVDGGTSRFDKNGKIYHAVCAACGGDANGFTSTPGVYSETNNSTNCNLAAFKFELNSIQAIVSAPSTYICIPDPVVFQNNSQFGNDFQWTFGDGDSSNLQNPTHFYLNPGSYFVTLVVSDTNNCFLADSTSFQVNIGDFQGGVVQPVTPICFGDVYQLEAYGGSMYSWTPANVLDDPTSPTPIATISQTTLFTVVVSDSCGVDTVQVTLEVYPTIPIVSNDTSLCIGNSVPIYILNTISQTWSPSSSLNDPTIFNPIATPTTTTLYSVTGETVEHCLFTLDVNVIVFTDVPETKINDTINYCYYDSAKAIVSGAQFYNWYPNIQISSLTNDTVYIKNINDAWYYCDFTNSCGTVTDSVFIDVLIPNVTAGNDSIICPKTSATLWAKGADKYTWSPSNTVENYSSENTLAYPLINTNYQVIGIDSNTCIDTANVQINVFPDINLIVSSDLFAYIGDQVQLNVESNVVATYLWEPSDFLTCINCTNPIASPNQTFTYFITVTDTNSCEKQDSVIIHYEGLLYVPNTFTPDGTKFNEYFKAIGVDIYDFEIMIFNRWGELIFSSNSFNDSWDGTYKGLPCPVGTYTWKIVYSDYNIDRHEQVGHINLVR